MSGIDKTSSFGFEIIMKKIVLASANTHKFKEFERIFKTQFPEIQLISLSVHGDPLIQEYFVFLQS